MDKRGSFDVVVVGGGVIGASCAIALAQAGLRSVVVEERPELFRGSTAAGFGSLTPFSDPYFSGEARAFAARGVDLYRDSWLAELRPGATSAVRLVDEGLLQLCPDPAAIAKVEAHVEELLAAGFQAALLDIAEVRKLEPALTGDYVAALHLREPWLDLDELLVELQAALSARAEVTLRLADAVTRIDGDEASLHVTTRDGAEIDCKYVVVATGLSTAPVGGIPEPALRWVRGDAIAAYGPSPEPLLRRHIYMGDGFITPRATNRLLLGATYEVEDGPPPDWRRNTNRVEVRHVASLLEANRRILPILDSCDMGEMWRGWRPTAADELPLLGTWEPDDRLIYATGFIGLGITMAPAVAEAVATYCGGAPKQVFPSVFDPNRSGALIGSGSR